MSVFAFYLIRPTLSQLSEGIWSWVAGRTLSVAFPLTIYPLSIPDPTTPEDSLDQEGVVLVGAMLWPML